MLRLIVIHRDSTFLSQFWDAFFKFQGSILCRSSAYHPQSDGQTEVLNRTLEHYLRCFVGDKPSSWTSYFPWAEWWYNTSFHFSIQMSPFEALYGRPPPTISSYTRRSTAVHQVDVALRTRDELLSQLRHNVLLPPNRMKQKADKNRTEREFNEGDMVFLKLQPYR